VLGVRSVIPYFTMLWHGEGGGCGAKDEWVVTQSVGSVGVGSEGEYTR
jgi:hypothetical protein